MRQQRRQRCIEHRVHEDEDGDEQQQAAHPSSVRSLLPISGA
jgi:hypothetical protein